MPSSNVVTLAWPCSVSAWSWHGSSCSREACDVSAIRDRDLDHVAVRAELLQATWNYERQQGVGWAWALEPVLRRLYPSAPERARRLAEHTAYFNTQPTLASLALGAVAKLEEQRALGGGPDASSLARIKAVLGS